MPVKELGHHFQFASWSVPQFSREIEYPLEVMEEIRAFVCDELLQLSHGGDEVGGILFGTRRDDRLRILTWRPIACEHSQGEALRLSYNDRMNLAVQLEMARQNPDLKELRPLGWFVSHLRDGVSLSTSDQEIYNGFFPDASQITLVICPQPGRRAQAGFFVREPDDKLQTETSHRCFEIEPLHPPQKTAAATRVATAAPLKQDTAPEQDLPAEEHAPQAPAITPDSKLPERIELQEQPEGASKTPQEPLPEESAPVVEPREFLLPAAPLFLDDVSPGSPPAPHVDTNEVPTSVSLLAGDSLKIEPAYPPIIDVEPVQEPEPAVTADQPIIDIRSENEDIRRQNEEIKPDNGPDAERNNEPGLEPALVWAPATPFAQVEAPLTPVATIHHSDPVIPAPVERAIPAPIEPVIPAPVERAIPAPIEPVIPAPVEQAMPAPVERTIPVPVELAIPAPPSEPVRHVELPIPPPAPPQAYSPEPVGGHVPLKAWSPDEAISRLSPPKPPPNEQLPVAQPASEPIGMPSFQTEETIPTHERWLWAIPIILALAIAGFMLYQRRDPNPAHSVALRAWNESQTVHLVWDANSRAIRDSDHASMDINDGGKTSQISLSADQLHAGKMSYLPQSNDVGFAMTVYPADGDPVHDYTRLIAPSLHPTAPTTQSASTNTDGEVSPQAKQAPPPAAESSNRKESELQQEVQQLKDDLSKERARNEELQNVVRILENRLGISSAPARSRRR